MSATVVTSAAFTEAKVLQLGCAFGSTGQKRATRTLSDNILSNPTIVTNCAITVGVPAAAGPTASHITTDWGGGGT